MSELTQVFVGLGSNINPQINMRRAIAAIQTRYQRVQISPVYESSAHGFEGANFLNAVARFETQLSAHLLAEEIKALELTLGRKSNEVGMSDRHIDIDLLLYGDLVDEALKVPRYDITHFVFVLKPLADVYPEGVHPVQQKMYAELLETMDATVLQKVNLAL